MITDDLREKLLTHDQAHLLQELERLNDADRAQLLNDLARIDLAELRALHGKREHKDALPERHRIEPLPRPAAEEPHREFKEQIGNDAIERSEIAYLVVAGGQGTRLGFDHPKGMFPIGPLSKRSLFQIHAEKILALRRRCGARLPLLVMTSPATDAETRLYFRRKNFFRLPPQDVWFFCQGTMPAVDLTTGRLLLEGPGRLCLSPNGHGGTITGLLGSGLLDRLTDQGVHTIYYFQVDNPLVNLADFLFIGRHVEARAEVSSKVLPKTSPLEKVGNFLMVDGRCSMIEYSDLPEGWANETDDAGNLRFWAGNPAIHLLDVEFLRKIAGEAERLPWHLARKIVPYVNETGQVIKPDAENALKFERFIFDILPQAERWTIHATDRAAEFAPVKNKEGVDSPQTARAMMCADAARLLGQLGVEVPAGIKVEISPLFTLDNNRTIPPITKHTYLREPKD
ncbi:MAG: UDPGP type 1 family protein [Planctomycetes bacterium]|jgi:UDP-N-acetylglucosamine/UDP-N-acetylgalactosamine diphosphorylase|nr:UDPGP type 1 family protein [Planctomycetota bacterium]